MPQMCYIDLRGPMTRYELKRDFLQNYTSTQPPKMPRPTLPGTSQSQTTPGRHTWNTASLPRGTLAGT
eukprot:1916874-Pyramimonas_sp.AAC.1